jgi:hypothetical protein
VSTALHYYTALLHCTTTLHYYTALLHCIVLHCTVLYCTTLHYTILDYSALYYSALYYSALYNTALHYSSLDCTTLYYTARYYSALYNPTPLQHITAYHRIKLHSEALTAFHSPVHRYTPCIITHHYTLFHYIAMRDMTFELTVM